jgi:hypothetical protein
MAAFSSAAAFKRLASAAPRVLIKAPAVAAGGEEVAAAGDGGCLPLFVPAFSDAIAWTAIAR